MLDLVFVRNVINFLTLCGTTAGESASGEADEFQRARKYKKQSYFFRGKSIVLI